MTATLPLRIDGKPIRAPRKGVVRGGSRPAWSEYRPKAPVECDHCVQVAYETAMAGEAYPGMRTARRKRRQDGKNLLLCHEHAQIQQAQDRVDFPVTESTSTGGGKRGKQVLD